MQLLWEEELKKQKGSGAQRSRVLIIEGGFVMNALIKALRESGLSVTIVKVKLTPE